MAGERDYAVVATRSCTYNRAVPRCSGLMGPYNDPRDPYDGRGDRDDGSKKRGDGLTDR